MASRVKAEQAGLVKRWVTNYIDIDEILQNLSGNRDNKRQRDAYSTTMMLIVVIAVFLSVETPLMVITALHTISSRWGKIIRLGGGNKLAIAVNFQRYGLS